MPRGSSMHQSGAATTRGLDRLLSELGGAVALTVLLTYGGALWLQVLHAAEGGHEANEPGAVLHWLRDATLALPLVALVALTAVILARRLMTRAAVDPQSLFGRLTTAVAAAFGAAYAFGAGSPIHGQLFNATHGGHEL